MSDYLNQASGSFPDCAIIRPQSATSANVAFNDPQALVWNVSFKAKTTILICYPASSFRRPVDRT